MKTFRRWWSPLALTGRTLALALAWLCGVAGCREPVRPPGAASPLIVRDATVIDGTGAPPRTNTTLVIEDGRIAEMGPIDVVDIPSSAQVIDASEQYVIPGLWDTHVHLSKAKAEALPVLIANGVTSVRDMGGDLEELRAWQRAIRDGDLVGPRIMMAGPMLETPATIDRIRAKPTRERWAVTRVPVADSASAQQVVDSIAALGVDFIKIREAASTTVYIAVVRAAQRHRLPIAGHAPYSMDPTEGAALGVASFEHASYPYPLDADPNARARILEAFVRNDIVIVPTLVAWRTHLMDRDSLWALVQDSLGRRDPRRRLISNFLAEEWRLDVQSDKRKTNETLHGWHGFFSRQADDLRAMHDAGVTMLPGSDLAGPSLFPGYALHDELENLVHLVGLTPLEAIESATRRPAEFFGLAEDLGTLETGKLADLVLLDGNPLADIAHTRRIVGVVADGRYFGAEELRVLLGGLSATTEGDIELFQRLK